LDRQGNEPGEGVEKMPKDVREQNVDDMYNLVVGEPATVMKGDLLKKAVDAMVNKPLSQSVYVIDKKGTLLGVIAMDGLLKQVGYRIGARKTGFISFIHLMSDLLKDDVEQFMEKPVIIKKEMLLKEALKLMVEKKLNNLPVVDDKGILIGELNGLEILVAARKLFDGKDAKQ
jgi:CBS domain-containing protein